MSNFFCVTFIASTGQQQVGRTFTTLRQARKNAAAIAKFATNVRIMRGGPGGMEDK